MRHTHIFVGDSVGGFAFTNPLSAPDGREPVRPRGLVRADLRLIAQREADIVEPLEQPRARVVVDRETRVHAGRLEGTALQIDRDLRRRIGAHGVKQKRHRGIVELDREQALLLKMSAKRVETTARKPLSWSAHTACSREEPQPKFGPARRIDAPRYRGSFRTKPGSRRQASNSPAPYPVRSSRLSQWLGMI